MTYNEFVFENVLLSILTEPLTCVVLSGMGKGKTLLNTVGAAFTVSEGENRKSYGENDHGMTDDGVSDVGMRDDEVDMYGVDVA
jgi:hypothetical protein